MSACEMKPSEEAESQAKAVKQEPDDISKTQVKLISSDIFAFVNVCFALLNH